MNSKGHLDNKNQIFVTSGIDDVTFSRVFPPVKFIYSEKATKFCKIFTLLLSYVVPVKSKVKISQNFVAFSEYMNFNFVFGYFYRPLDSIVRDPDPSTSNFLL